MLLQSSAPIFQYFPERSIQGTSNASSEQKPPFSTALTLLTAWGQKSKGANRFKKNLTLKWFGLQNQGCILLYSVAHHSLVPLRQIAAKGLYFYLHLKMFGWSLFEAEHWTPATPVTPVKCDIDEALGSPATAALSVPWKAQWKWVRAP